MLMLFTIMTYVQHKSNWKKKYKIKKLTLPLSLTLLKTPTLLNFYFDCFFFSSVAIIIPPPPPQKKKMFCSYVFEKHDLKTTQNTIRGGRVHFCAFFGATFLQTAVCIPVLAGHPAQEAANSLFLLLLVWKYFLFFSSTKLLYKTLHTHVTYHYTNIKKKTEYLRKFLILTYPFLF